MHSIKIDTCGHVHDHLSAHVSIQLWSPNKWSRIWRSHARALWGPPGGREHYQQIIADLNDGCIFKSNESIVLWHKPFKINNEKILWVEFHSVHQWANYAMGPNQRHDGEGVAKHQPHHIILEKASSLNFEGCKRHLSFWFFGISVQQWIKIGWGS